MAKVDYKDMTTEQLEAKLASTKPIQITVAIIFAVIIMAWIIGGYWLQNMPVFIVTVVMGVGVTAALYASGNGVRQELQKRREAPPKSSE